MAVELRVLTAAGAYSEILPDWSDLTFSQDLLDTGSLTFNYPTIGRNASYLKHGVQLALLLDGIEPLSGRFTYFEGTGSRIAESGGSLQTYGCKSNLGRFDQMMLAPAYGSTTADPNMFAYTNRTPGYLLATAVDNCMSRANQRSSTPAPWFTHPLTGFSAANDSSGVAWPKTYDVTFDPGTSVSEVIDWLVKNGLAEPIMDKKILKLYAPANNGRNLTTGSSQIVLQVGRDFTEASYQTSSLDLVNAVCVLGDTNSCAWVYDNASIAEHGYREIQFKVSGASTQSTLINIGNVYLSTRKLPRWAYSYAVSALYLDRPYGLPRPFIDFQVGDTILILDGVENASRRLRLLSATWPNSRAASVNLTVNDWFAERDVEFERRLERLGG